MAVLFMAMAIIALAQAAVTCTSRPSIVRTQRGAMSPRRNVCDAPIAVGL
jgi:hypothetical protein